MMQIKNQQAFDFYEAVASEFLYCRYGGNAEKAITEQGLIIDKLLRKYSIVGETQKILDCSCGVGTQSLGLAQCGYTKVHATDLSPNSVYQAEARAKSLGLKITFGVADFLRLPEQIAGRFEAVISFDNSVPHLVGDGDLAKGFSNMLAMLNPGGRLLVSVRDYDKILAAKPQLTEPMAFENSNEKFVIVYLWDWKNDGKTYEMTVINLKRSQGIWETKTYPPMLYRAYTKQEFLSALKSAGFAEIEWLQPEETGYFQPILSAKKPA